MTSVLLLINEEAHIRELSRVADLLLDNTFRPVVFVEVRMKPHLDKVRLAETAGIETLTSDTFATEAIGPSAVDTGVRITGWAVAKVLSRMCRTRRHLRLWWHCTPYMPSGLAKRLNAFLSFEISWVDVVRNIILGRSAVCHLVFK